MRFRTASAVLLVVGAWARVFVLTHEVRAPWDRKGGTTFHFVNDGIEAALRRAREAAGEKDVRISGGGATVLQVLNAGLVGACGRRREHRSYGARDGLRPEHAGS